MSSSYNDCGTLDSKVCYCRGPSNCTDNKCKIRKEYLESIGEQDGK